MTGVRTVLIVDDEEGQVLTLRDAFERRTKYFKYKVTSKSNIDDCLSLETEQFDVCVVDLGFGDSLPGFNLLIGLNCLRDGGAGIVYSAYPETKNVVVAMQLGATAFYSKMDYAPDEFAIAVDQQLNDDEEKLKKNAIVADYIIEHSVELERKYPGKIVGIEFDNSGPVVVASGNSRLEMLLEYQRQHEVPPTNEANQPQASPKYPYIHQVPSGIGGDMD